MDYDQALRIACFYGKIIEVESLLWMEADPSSVLFNHRDRGTAFHPSVNPAVRDGINDLLSDSSGAGAGVADADSRRSTGGGAAAAAALKAAREAAAAWGGDGDGGSPAKNPASSASTSTGWESSSCSLVSDGNESAESGGGGGGGGDARRVRPSFGLGREDLGGEDDEDDIGSDDDAFVMPSMLTLENDLIRAGSYFGNGDGAGNGKSNKKSSANLNGGNKGAAADTSLASTGAVAAMRRFGQRVREGVTGSSSSRGSDGSASTSTSNTSGGGRSSSASVSPTSGNLKDKARARFAGVMKWAQSPRKMGAALSPRGRARTRGFAG